jgi:hypothetical protein
MIHPNAPSQPRLARCAIPPIRWSVTCITAAAIAWLAGARDAFAVPLPPTDGGGIQIAPPPTDTMAAHFPLWGAIAMVAATVVLSVATTLVTLSLQQLRPVRTPAIAAEARPAAQTVSTTAEPMAGHGDIAALLPVPIRTRHVPAQRPPKN